MANISVSKQEAVIEVLKKEFPNEASTIIRDVIKIQVNLEN